MRKIRVLIVDDSVVVRRLIHNVLSDDTALEVAGVASNGKIALDKIKQLNPDVVTLDIEMPVMDGLQAMREIHLRHPRLPVIMFSTLTERGARASLEALALGARDYVTKPSNVGSITAGMQRLREDLIPKLKVHCPGLGESVRPQGIRFSKPSLPVRSATAIRSKAATAAGRSQRIDVVAIGVSTGGPNALAEVIPRLSAKLSVPVVIVQHMPPIFTKLLAERLNEQSAIAVHEAAVGDKVLPGHIWIAPGGNHMEVLRKPADVRIRLQQEAKENSCRPAVDVLFRSVARAYGAHVLAVILTGMGQDGKLGCQAIHEAGGQVIVQDEASSVVWGMPGAVAQAGMADAVLPLAQIPVEIQRRVQASQPPIASGR